MDKTSVAGLLIGLVAILGGQLLEGGHLDSLLQPAAFLIVIGGTLGAVMLQSPPRIFRDGIRLARWVFFPPLVDPGKTIADIVRWNHMARKDGLLSLEAQISILRDPFAARGLQLLVDGAEPEKIHEVLEVEINAWESSLKASARVWESAGGYSPTIGIIAAVMGLIHVMENLSDPSKLGSGIAVAFVATIYGVGAANLLFLPIARKLMANIVRVVTQREMLVDGLVGIAHGENPHIIESRLRGYFANGSV